MLSQSAPMRRRSWLVLASAATALSGCGVVARQVEGAADVLTRTGHYGRTGRLTPVQLQWAKTAWRYVENNTDFERGLVNGLDRRPLMTTWNAADALAAIVAAHELGVLPGREFDYRLSRLLGFLASMDLSGGQLPARAYNAGTGKMVNAENKPQDTGWSALDIGRLMLWLRIVGQRHPVYQEYADKAVLRWRFCDVLDDCGALYGVTRTDKGEVRRAREGRFGYEQLAAAGFAAWGFDASRSASLPALEAVNIYGLPVPFDARDPRVTGVPAPVLTMPHVLLGMELGWEPPGGAPGLRPIAERIALVQELRWRRDHQLTARTEYEVAEPPHRVLDAVYAAGYAWNTIAPDGKELEKLAIVSTRAAFGMWALWPGEYTDQLIEGVRYLFDPDRGWYEGRLEATGAPQNSISLATNAGVLEALLFKAKGRLYSPQSPRGFFHQQTGDPLRPTEQCMPGERPACRAGKGEGA